MKKVLWSIFEAVFLFFGMAQFIIRFFLFLIIFGSLYIGIIIGGTYLIVIGLYHLFEYFHITKNISGWILMFLLFISPFVLSDLLDKIIKKINQKHDWFEYLVMR